MDETIAVSKHIILEGDSAICAMCFALLVQSLLYEKKLTYSLDCSMYLRLQDLHQ